MKKINTKETGILKSVNSNNLGITLVSLIVTLIIILILAGVSMSLITGNADFFSKANNAADRMNVAEKNEQEEYNNLMDFMNIYSSKSESSFSEYTQPVITYTVTFDANGGTLTETTREIEKGSTIGILPIPEKNRYLFDGWFTERNGGEKITEKQQITEDITYYAHWSDLYCTVTFDANGGTLTETTREIEKESTIGILPIPEKNRYLFDGWFTERNGGEQITEEQQVTEDITYYAHWSDFKIAEVNGVRYDTLKLALASIKTSNETVVKLLTNTVENVKIEKGRNIVLNLQNFEISNNTASSTEAVITNEGTLNISNGTIKTVAKAAAINNNAGGNITISGGRIIATGLRQAFYNNGGTAEITGTAYFSAKTAERGTVQNLESGIMYINGGTIISENFCAVDNTATLTIGKEDGNVSTSSPVLQGATHGVRTNNSFIFNDGIIRGLTSAIGVVDTSSNGIVIVRESNFEKKEMSEVIEDKTYNTLYLVPK